MSERYTRAVSMTKRKKSSMMLPEIESVRREHTQVAALGQVLPQQAVGVFVNAALPGTVRIGEVDLHPGGFRQPLMFRHFPALVVGQRQALLRRDTIEHMTEAGERRFGTGVLHPRQHREQGGALHQGTDRRTVVHPFNEIAFPMPRS